ncbi:hypothetical protein JYK14_06480 [Siccirubricoccus sp. KC 17139]|uniref:C2H2-type domain-containing protein n=1 Tax=Siccirubricoccus soli TaxID=2899147 RepID=A0ABT1D1L9_9PROT|nr:hypothetical protein [Siccirubricoccus soli]MCO6415822.1 hypothetical protein [Siccirubricoccus soli]MCP2681954.1 hypothetical protein [Siccirubricoccus soli]
MTQSAKLRHRIASLLAVGLRKATDGSDPSPTTGAREVYYLYVDKDRSGLILKAADQRALEREHRPRLVAADLRGRRLRRVTLSDLRALTVLRDIEDEEFLRELHGAVADFIPIRNSTDAPYWGVLSYRAARPDIDVRDFPLSTVSAAIKRNVKVGVSYSDSQEPSVSCSIDDYIGVGGSILDEADLRLISFWQSGRMARNAGAPPGQKLKENSLRSLAYARAAEKMVIGYYQQLGTYSVRDVSIEQVGSGDHLWKSGDVEVDGALLDVKNALSYRARVRHVYVPKFKRDRNQDVAIAGVITRITKKDSSEKAQQIFLGTVTMAKLATVRRAINSLAGRTQEVAIEFHDNSLPPWVFEIEEAAIDYETLLDWSLIFALQPTTTLAIAIACGRERTTATYHQLNLGQREAVDLLADATRTAGYSKATIGLFAISEFIARCVRGEDAAAFIRLLRKLLVMEDFEKDHLVKDISSETGFRDEDLKYEIRIKLEGSSSGGLVDPVGSLDALLKLLGQCAEGIQRSGIRFVHFDVPHPYIMLGKAESDAMLTIFAYCGGRLGSGAPCNNFPLVIAQHPNCDECGKLICDHCDFCSERCPRYHSNQEDEEHLLPRRGIGDAPPRKINFQLKQRRLACDDGLPSARPRIKPRSDF